MKLDELRIKLKTNNVASPRKPYFSNSKHNSDASKNNNQRNIPFIGTLSNNDNKSFREIFYIETNQNDINANKTTNLNDIDNGLEDNTNKLKIIGITGSRGKSSVAYIVHEYLKKIGYKSILYSSITIDSPLSLSTNGEAVENPLRNEVMLLDAIEEAIEYEADYLVLEVNERAINLGLTKDIPFDIRVLTNITPKQNDVFYEDYVNIKKAFFREAEKDVTLISSQIDEGTVSLKNELLDRNIITFSSKYLSSVYKLNENNIDYLLTSNDKVFDSLDGLNLTVKTKLEEYNITSNLIMPYNALNITCCVAVLDTLKVYNKDLFQVLIQDIVIPGRDEVIKASDRTIIISVNLVPHLENLKRYQSRGELNKIIVVTGATGIDFVSWDKEFEENKYLEDKEKSIKFAYNYIKNNCDLVYITTSDSGTANKEGLLGYQANMVKGSIPYMTEVNRKTAIKKAIESSKENDVIFISGRGNRRVMCDTINKMTLHLDKEVVIDILEELNWR